jgi:hypothetical protein
MEGKESLEISEIFLEAGSEMGYKVQIPSLVVNKATFPKARPFF